MHRLHIFPISPHFFSYESEGVVSLGQNGDKIKAYMFCSCRCNRRFQEQESQYRLERRLGTGFPLSIILPSTRDASVLSPYQPICFYLVKRSGNKPSVVNRENTIDI